MDRLLGAAKELSRKVESNEGAAGELLRQAESLQQELKAMRQYRECVQAVGGGPGEEGGHVRLPNIEFSYIKQLQRDNSELRTLLEEHQAALQMIMTKYREQVSMFMETSHDERVLGQDGSSEELRVRTEQVYTMAAVMYTAARHEDACSDAALERVAKLEYENHHLRQLLQFSTSVIPAGPAAGEAPGHPAAGSNCVEGNGTEEGPSTPTPSADSTPTTPKAGSPADSPRPCHTPPKAVARQPVLELTRDNLSLNSLS